jgi:hypothetical protein
MMSWQCDRCNHYTANAQKHDCIYDEIESLRAENIELRKIYSSSCPECGYAGCVRGRKSCDLEIEKLDDAVQNWHAQYLKANQENKGLREENNTFQRDWVPGWMHERVVEGNKTMRRALEYFADPEMYKTFEVFNETMNQTINMMEPVMLNGQTIALEALRSCDGCPCGSQTSAGCSVAGCPLYLEEEK